MERFAEEMDTLLEITLRSQLVEKLSMALYDCLFEDQENEEETTEAECKVGMFTIELYCSRLVDVIVLLLFVLIMIGLYKQDYCYY